MQVVKSRLSRRAFQAIMKMPRQRPVERINTHLHFRRAVVRDLLRHRHADALREETDRLDIFKVFNLADKCDHIAACAAAKAVKRLVVRINGKRRRFFRMERAQPVGDTAAPL